MYSQYVTALTSLLPRWRFQRAGERKDRESEAAAAPDTSQSAVDEFLGHPDVFGIVRDYLDPASMEKLRLANETARERLLEVPREARPTQLAPLAGDDLEKKALLNAKRLLRKTYVQTFLTGILFPAEQAVMNWVYEDRDVKALLNRELQEESHHDYKQWQRWTRCMERFIKTCKPKIEACRRGIEVLFFAMEEEDARDCLRSPVMRVYEIVEEYLCQESLFYFHVKFGNWETYRRLQKQYAIEQPGDREVYREWPIVHPHPIPDVRLGDAAAERELATFFTSAKISDDGRERFPMQSFEQFARLIVPAVFRYFRAAVVFMHAWFPFTQWLVKNVYQFNSDDNLNLTVPDLFARGMCDLGEGSFDQDVNRRIDARAWWRSTYTGSLQFRNREVARASIYLTERVIKEQFFLFLAYEFGVAYVASRLYDPRIHYFTRNQGTRYLPANRLTANAIVDRAKALCVEPTFRRLQNELARVEFKPAEAQAVRERARTIFKSPTVFDTEPRALEDNEEPETSAASSSSSSAHGTQRAPAFERDDVVRRIEDALGMRSKKRAQSAVDGKPSRDRSTARV